MEKYTITAVQIAQAAADDNKEKIKLLEERLSVLEKDFDCLVKFLDKVFRVPLHVATKIKGI